MSYRSRILTLVLVLLGLSGLPACRASPDGSSSKPSLGFRTDPYGDPLPEGAIQRLGTLRFRPAWGSTPLGFLPDGETLVVLVKNGKVLYFDVRSGRVTRKIEWEGKLDRGYRDPVQDVSFLPREKKLRIAVRVGDGARVLDMTDGRTLSDVATEEFQVLRLALSLDGSTLACVGCLNPPHRRWPFCLEDHGVVIWDVESGSRHRTLGMGTTLIHTSFRISADGGRIAFTSGDPPELGVWDTVSGDQMLRFRKELGGYCGPLTFSPDGERIALGGRLGLQVWEVPAGRKILEGDPWKLQPTQIHFSPDGRWIAAAEWKKESGLVQVLDADTGRELGRIETEEYRGGHLQFQAQGTRVATGCSDGRVRIWEVPSGKEVLELEGNVWEHSSVLSSPDGRVLVANGSDSKIHIWDAETGESLNPDPLPSMPATRLVWSPAGEVLAAMVGDSQNIVLWDPERGEHTEWPPVEGGGIDAGAFSPDRRLLATAGAGRIFIRDGTSGQVLRSWDCRFEPFQISVAFSPDGNTLALATTPEHPCVAVHEVLTGKEIFRIEDGLVPMEGCVPVAFTADGGTVLCLTEQEDGTHVVRAWEVSTGKEVSESMESLTHPALVSLFSPSGRTRWVVDWTPGRFLSLLRGDPPEETPWVDHPSDISPDGKWLATTDEGAAILIWDTTTQQVLQRIEGHRGSVCSLAFRPDGKALACGLDDSTILIWDLDAPDPDR